MNFYFTNRAPNVPLAQNLLCKQYTKIIKLGNFLQMLHTEKQVCIRMKTYQLEKYFERFERGIVKKYKFYNCSVLNVTIS